MERRLGTWHARSFERVGTEGPPAGVVDRRFLGRKLKKSGRLSPTRGNSFWGAQRCRWGAVPSISRSTLVSTTVGLQADPGSLLAGQTLKSWLAKDLVCQCRRVCDPGLAFTLPFHPRLPVQDKEPGSRDPRTVLCHRQSRMEYGRGGQGSPTWRSSGQGSQIHVDRPALELFSRG